MTITPRVTIIAALAAVALAWPGTSSQASGQDAGASVPVIEQVTPATPAPQGAPQRLAFAGQDFRAGLDLEVLSPDGQTTVIGGADILDRRETSFAALVALPVEGSYTFSVRNTDGGVSQPFVVKVAPGTPEPPAPVITGTIPAELSPQPQAQTLKVTGEHFEAGLHAIVTNDAGQELTEVQVSSVKPDSFTLTVLLDRRGEFELLVSNPSGGASNVWRLTVR